MNRRRFCNVGSSCAAHIWFAATLLPPAARRAFATRSLGPAVVREPWGNLERLSENIWAMVSTPLAGGPDARRTLSNGGIVAGRSGVLIVEGFASDDGAKWIAETAATLTGRRPTHVVLTHYHGDHSGGLAGYRSDGSDPIYVTTRTTRALLEQPAGRPGRADPAAVLADAELVAADQVHSIDLGGVRVTVTPRFGHTESDLTVTVDDPRVVFCGDLLWNGMFPNYRDATPSVLSREVRAMIADPAARYVPGHGSMPTNPELQDYVELLDVVEAAARRAHRAGLSAEEAATQFPLPAKLSTWTMFSDRYYQVALSAWERELVGG